MGYLYCKEPDEYDMNVVLYKSGRRLNIEKDGLRIQGNSGD